MAMLQMNVLDVDALLATFKACGAQVVTVDGLPLDLGQMRIAMVREPNDLLLELIQRSPQCTLRGDLGV